MRQLVVEGGQDVVARRLAILQGHDALGRKSELFDQRFADALRIAHRVLQFWPLRIIIDADHHGPGIGVARGDGHFLGCGRRAFRHLEAAAIPACELIAFSDQLVEHGRQGFHRALMDVMEQDDAASRLVDGGQHAIRDGAGHGIGPVQRIDIPHHGFQMRIGQRGHAFAVARAIRKTEQRGPLGADGFQQGVRAEDFAFQLVARLFRQLGVTETVVAHGIALFHQLAAHFRARIELGVAFRVERAQVAAHVEEDGRHAILFQDGADFFRVAAVRAVVEGQHDGFLRQAQAKDFRLIFFWHRLGFGYGTGGWHRIRYDDAVFLQNLFAAVELFQLRHVIVPAFALEFNGTLAQVAEDLPDFLLVIALDLAQRIEVFGNTLVQLDRRQGRILGHIGQHALQQFAESQAVRVIQAGIGFDIREQTVERFEAARIRGRRQLIQRKIEPGDAFLVFMEQRLPHFTGFVTRAFRQALLVGQQHDDLAEIAQQVAELAGHGGRIDGGLGRGGRAARGGSARRGGSGGPRIGINAGPSGESHDDGGGDLDRLGSHRLIFPFNYGVRRRTCADSFLFRNCRARLAIWAVRLLPGSQALTAGPGRNACASLASTRNSRSVASHRPARTAWA